MRFKLFLTIAALSLATGIGFGNAKAAITVPAGLIAPATSGSELLTPARWSCWAVPGSGMGRQCRWVETPGWRWGGGQRCWVERIPGSGLGPHTVCR
jgi:hypothetical protein